MHTLTYISQYQGAKDDFANCLSDIYRASQRNNPKLMITGVLLYSNDCFLQTLEGEKDTIEQLFDKITSDPRHNQVRLLFSNVIRQRSYPSWNMQPINLSSSELFNHKNVFALTQFIASNIELDNSSYHALLSQLLNDPNIDRVLAEISLAYDQPS